LRQLLGWPAGKAIGGAESLPLDSELRDILRSLVPDAPEPAMFRVEDGRMIRGARYRASFSGSTGHRRTLIMATTRDLRSLLDAASPRLHSSLPEGTELLILDLRGDQGRRHLHLLATDSQLLGQPMLGRRARDLASIIASEPVRRRGNDEDIILLAAADPHAALVVLAVQALEAPASRIILTGLAESPRSPLDGDLDPDEAVWRFLAVTDVPSLLRQVNVPVVRLPEEAGLPALIEAAAEGS
jgi:hypothetical protein